MTATKQTRVLTPTLYDEDLGRVKALVSCVPKVLNFHNNLSFKDKKTNRMLSALRYCHST